MSLMKHSFQRGTRCPSRAARRPTHAARLLSFLRTPILHHRELCPLLAVTPVVVGVALFRSAAVVSVIWWAVLGSVYSFDLSEVEVVGER